MTLEELVNSKILIWTVPIYFVFIFIEMGLVRFAGLKGNKNASDDFVSMGIGLASVVTNGAAAFLTIGMLFWFAQFKVMTIPLTIWTFLLCFLLDDARYYFGHRIAHRCRWPWAMHVTHHTSNRFTLAVSLRQGWTKHLAGITILKIPLVLIGFDPVLVLFCGALNAFYQFFLHTEAIDKMPRWFEAVFNTPSHHRVHHGRNPQYLDMNYAGTLIIWDRLFGTFTAEDPNDPVDYGLVNRMHSLNPIKIVFHEYWSIVKDVFGRGRSLKHRILYLLAPPGWSHDGSRLTSHDIKRDAGISADTNAASAE